MPGTSRNIAVEREGRSPSANPHCVYLLDSYLTDQIIMACEDGDTGIVHTAPPASMREVRHSSANPQRHAQFTQTLASVKSLAFKMLKILEEKVKSADSSDVHHWRCILNSEAGFPKCETSRDTDYEHLQVCTPV